MKLLYITNIPSPYRIDFFNYLGTKTDLTVLFEARRVKSTTFNWLDDEQLSFKEIVLSKNFIEEKKINWKIIKYIKKKQYDCLIFTNYAYFTEMIALLYAKLLAIPYVLEIDGGIIKKESFIKRKIKKTFINHASYYISPGVGGDKYLMHYGVKKKLIYRSPFSSIKANEILPDTINNDCKMKYKKRIGFQYKQMVLFVGQTIHRKGIDILLNAANGLSREIGICIVGGELKEEYAHLITTYNLTNVCFEHFITRDQLDLYYRAADVFVLPTREDVWGLVINEAMSYGLPIITTDSCGAGLELVSDNGFIIPTNNSQELCDKIDLILSNNSLQHNMSYRSLKKIQKYTIENMVECHIKIFSKNLSKDAGTD